MKMFTKILKNILFYVFFIFLSVVLFISVKSKLTNEVPSIFGYKAFTVVTGSMEPTINIGSLIIVEEVDSKEINTQDIITYRNENTNSVTTHRVVDIDYSDGIKFITKGDANNVKDNKAINFDLLEGRVVRVFPSIGKIAILVQSYKIYILSLIMFISIIFSLISIKAKNKIKLDGISNINKNI